jgi:hypothetical protein
MTEDLVFEEAKRSQAYIKVGFTGPSGSGKTVSSLLVARGLVEDWREVGLVCSEGGSGKLYANYDRKGVKIGRYMAKVLEPPYHPSKYVSIIEAAIKQGLKVLILDTISHAWAGVGGLLDKHGRLADSGKFNSFTAWRIVTPDHNEFVDAMVQSPIHLIANLRVKTEWVVQQDERGKTRPVKVGLAPVQRDGMEYEFTIVFDLSQDHSVIVSKDRTGVFDGRIFTPSIETGQEMKAWLDEAEEEPARGPDTEFAEAEEGAEEKVADDDDYLMDEEETKKPAETEKETAKPAEEKPEEPAEKETTKPAAEKTKEEYKEEKSEKPAEEKSETKEGTARGSVTDTRIRIGKKDNFFQKGNLCFRTAKFIKENEVGLLMASNKERGKQLKELPQGKHFNISGTVLTEKEVENLPGEAKGQRVMELLIVKE